MRSAEILDQLDTAAEEFMFPDLGHGYNYAVDARLHAYRDAQRWALIVETLGFSPGLAISSTSFTSSATA